LALIPLWILLATLIRHYARIKVRNLEELRREFRRITSSRRPLIVCPNHLTLIDSALLISAFAPLSWYIKNYRYFCWNIPAAENIRKRWQFVVITALSKCIPIDRTGSKEHLESVENKLESLLRMGESIMIFPEGTRSRTGRLQIDKANYGVGKLALRVPNAQLLCVYLRGDKQETYSNFPHCHDTLSIEIKAIDCPQNNGLSESEIRRASRTIALQVMNTIKEMEDRYFGGKVAQNG
jgi:1-acyl-sn-glycerol-3-phosphate acyltransferase